HTVNMNEKVAVWCSNNYLVIGRNPMLLESMHVYSMSGSVGHIEKICDLAKKYVAITFLDKVRAVRMYSPCGYASIQYLKESNKERVSPSHIVPVLVGEAETCKIRLGQLITHTPEHNQQIIEHLVNALETIWQKNVLKFVNDWRCEGGKVGIGISDQTPKPIWTNYQLNSINNNAEET
ncbi:13628_t:CDS:2, partial [Entrophospora sp. SA101]